MKLKLADNLSLPVDVVTQTIAILAKRRAGKSYTMRRLVEQLHRAGQQVVLVDPKGDQWGVRSAADGKGPGLPIVILGGERGDVKPLEAGAGVAFFFKQWGEWQDGSDERKGFSGEVMLVDGRKSRYADDFKPTPTSSEWSALRPTMVSKVGKKRTGRLLDGREWNEFPEVRT